MSTMKKQKRQSFSFVILFVIFLMITTVLAWKNCSRNHLDDVDENDQKELSFRR